MPIELSSLDHLDDAKVNERLERLTAIIEDQGAEIEVRRGVIHDLVLRLHAVFGQAFSDAVDTLVNSTNPVLALQNTGAIDSTLLTAAASAQGVNRLNGNQASGLVTVVVSADQSLLIPRGFRLTTSDGRIFETTQAFAVRASGSVPEDLSNRILAPRGDGNYEVSINVTAISEGLSGNLRKGRELIPEQSLIRNFVTAYAASDFSGGTNEETDAQLLARMTQTIPASSLSTRSSVASVIRSSQLVPDLYAVSTIGYGDVELQRGRNLIERTGKVDSYVRTASLPVIQAVEVEATVTKLVDGSKATWQFALDRDAAPGFYNIASISDSEGLQFSDITMERGYDDSPILGELIPDIRSADEAAFSRFSTATVTCTTPSMGRSLGEKKTLTVNVRVMPYIEEIQSYLASREFRFVGGDTLVKAPIPIFVSINVQVYRRPGVSLPSAEPIRAAVANEFNLAGFSSVVHGSRVSTIVNNLLPVDAVVGNVFMIAETLRPDGTIDRRRTTDKVMALNEPSLSITGRTSAFICDPNNISVTAFEEAVSQVV